MPGLTRRQRKSSVPSGAIFRIAALRGLRDRKPEYLRYSDARRQAMELVPAGKNWRHLREKYPDRLKEFMGGAYDAGGGKVGFWRRLTYKKPCPTVPASPIQKGTSLCHPRKTRPLTVKEYARVQEFPDKYVIEGSTSKKYAQIGNAVPVGLGRAIGSALMGLIDLGRTETKERVAVEV